MNQIQFGAPKISKINKIILICSLSCFILGAILKAIGAFNLTALLGLSGAGLTRGLIFQLVTYPLVETQLMSFLFNGLLLWFIGSELENLWGTRIYSRFLILNIIGVGLIYVLISIFFFFGATLFQNPLNGLTGINYALLIAYALLYPDRQLSMMLIFPMRARTFCWILVGIQAYLALINSVMDAWAHLCAMGLSYLIIHFQNKPLIKRVLNQSFGAKKSSGKKHLYVVKDEDSKPPKYWQ
jgi:membrane associated rhomboid family serine protease